MTATPGQHPREDELVQAMADGLSHALRLVRFSDADEFLDELRLQRDTMQLPYIRCTALYRWDPQVTILQHVTAFAGFWGQVEYVELRHYCGSRMQGDSSEAFARWQAIRDQIEAACKALGCGVRGGVYVTQTKEV